MTTTLFPCLPLHGNVSALGCANLKKAYQEMPESYPLLHVCKDCPGVPGASDSAMITTEKTVTRPVPFNHPGAQPPKAKTQFPQARKKKAPPQEELYNPYIDAPCPFHPTEKQYGKAGVCLACLFKQVGVGK